jgi:broad specificity phosphatase PhoE
VGLDVTLDEGLRETFVGTWQGLTDAEIRERFPEEYAPGARTTPTSAAAAARSSPR